MENNKPINPRTDSDEIDLGQLFRMIGRGFNSIFIGFLKLFLYFKNNFIKLAILVFIGFAIGFALKYLISDELKTEIIVRPNFDSKDYLYTVVEEIETNLKVKDTAFFKEMGIVLSELKSLNISVEQVQEENREFSLENDIKYLETLQNFKDESFVRDVIKEEIQKKSSMNHRITFFYKDILSGRAATLKLMEYIENNNYFNELKNVYISNSHSKIESNEKLIKQIDNLISGFEQSLTSGGNMPSGTIMLDNEKNIELTSLLTLKNSLIKDSETKRIELIEQKEVINVINFGKTQKVRTPIYAQGITVIPALLLLFFFLFSFIKYLNKRADEIDQ